MIDELLLSNGIPFEHNISISSKTWIKRGGIAAYWITPKNTNELTVIIRYLYRNNLAFEIVGCTSNLYFLNDYNPNYVISTIKLNRYRIESDIIYCEPGALISRLANDCIKRGIAGYEGFCGLPGTVGGAVYNNSSCFRCEIAKEIESVMIITTEGNLRTMTSVEMEYSHRSSAMKSGKIQGVIVGVYLRRGLSGSVEILKESSRNNRQYRHTRQEGYLHNLGSTYAVLEQPKWSIRYFISLVMIKCMLLTEKDPSKVRHKRKIIFLRVYNYLNLKEYISDYNLNCFVWKDSKADELFWTYDIFLSKIYKKKKLEIEIKGNR